MVGIVFLRSILPRDLWGAALLAIYRIVQNQNRKQRTGAVWSGTAFGLLRVRVPYDGTAVQDVAGHGGSTHWRGSSGSSLDIITVTRLPSLYLSFCLSCAFD